MNTLKIFICFIYALMTNGNAIAGQWETSEGRCKRIGEKESAACTFITSANATSSTMSIILSDKTKFKVYESETDNKLNGTKAIKSEEDGFTCLADINNQKQNMCYK